MTDETMANGNGKENLNVTIDPELIFFLKEHARLNDRTVSGTVQMAVKTFLSIEDAKSPQYWEQKYAKAEV